MNNETSHLEMFITSHGGFGCDSCSKSILIAATMFGCRTCNYDLCSDCHDLAKKQSAGTIISENWKQAFECPSTVSSSVVSATMRVASTDITPVITHQPSAVEHLTAFQTPRDSFNCDGCQKRINAGATLHGCRSCNYDVCGDCFAAAAVVARVSPPQ